MLNLRNVFQEFERVGRGQVENVADGVALIANRKRFLVVATATADFASDVNIRQKTHLDAAKAVALAGFAAAAFHVETEAAGTVAAFARLRKHGKQIANGGKDASVSGGIGAGSAADGGLIDFDDFVDVLDAENHAMAAGRLLGAIELLREGAIENVVYKSGFAGAGDAGDDDE